MKRFILITLAFCLLLSCAAASDFDSHLLISYNATAKVYGAPQIVLTSVKSSGQNWLFDCENLSIFFELSPLGGIRTGAVYAKDENHTDEFLCACLAMLVFLGNFDAQAAGMLLLQFADVRAGKEPTPFYIGMDLFEIHSTDSAKYAMTYMNNDGRTSD